MDYVRREFEDRSLVYHAIDPVGIEGFSNVEENCAGELHFAEMPGYSSNESGELQRRAMPVSEPKQLVSQQSAFVYYM
jgi:hypothetical protein